MIRITHNDLETIAAGQEFAGGLQPGDVLALSGELGTGKTRFTKGVCRGLGVHDDITSPTFVILNEYTGGRLPVYHFDFYRLRSLAELSEIGFEEYLYGDGICVIEWAELVKQKLPERRFDISLTLGDSHDDRIITIETKG
jgi:tRNA threonylcarbamoyladenosine biosynthesis protein TsaE